MLFLCKISLHLFTLRSLLKCESCIPWLLIAVFPKTKKRQMKKNYCYEKAINAEG